jgi:predicted nucleotidyltransferase
MIKDFAEFLDALNKNGVRYVVIGGIAVLSHIPYRTTRDIDVLIEPSLENAQRARAAVQAWGSFEPEYAAEDFISGDILSFGGLLRVEIHSNVPGATWESVWEHRVPGELQGIPTAFAGIDDLIDMKRAAGRSEKDLPDLKRLEKLKAKGR